MKLNYINYVNSQNMNDELCLIRLVLVSACEYIYFVIIAYCALNAIHTFECLSKAAFRLRLIRKETCTSFYAAVYVIV